MILNFLYSAAVLLLSVGVVPTTALAAENNNRNCYDVIVVGGSSAGLSAALTLGRSLRKVLVVDDATPCNRRQPTSFNLLTHDGRPPSEIATIARQDVQKYDTVGFYSGLVTNVIQRKESDYSGSFQVETAAGGVKAKTIFEASKLVVATGVNDLLPKTVPGLQECWGTSVIHCPYCHGYEYRNKPTVLWMNAKNVMKMAPIVRTLTSDLTCILPQGDPRVVDDDALDQEQLELLEKHKIPLLQETVTEIQHDDHGKIDYVVLGNGEKLFVDAMYIRPPFEQRLPSLSLLPTQQGLEFDESGYIKVDDNQKTNVHGIMACGDCTTPNRSLSIAIASGTRAAKMLNYELSMEDWNNS